MKKAIEKMNQAIWELKEKIEEFPDTFQFRRDLIKFFHESALMAEKRAGVPEEDRSFLFLQEREAICCLLIHGAGGSPKEMRLLGEALFSEGYTAFGMRLPLLPLLSNTGSESPVPSWIRRGGTAGESMGAGTWSKCLAASSITIDTLLKYTANTYVIGFSFGGTIALALAASFPVRSTVLISPALYPVRTFRYLSFQAVRKVLPVAARSIAPREATMIEFMEMVRAELEPIELPMLVIQSSNDPMISLRGFNFLKRLSKNPQSRFILLPGDRHVLVDGTEFERVLRLSVDFIKGF